MFFPLILWIPLKMLIFWSLPFVVLSSVMKYAICSSIIGPLILIGTTPFCLGGILSVNFNCANCCLLFAVSCIC